jgi:hypothetical protein
MRARSPQGRIHGVTWNAVCTMPGIAIGVSGRGSDPSFAGLNQR